MLFIVRSGEGGLTVAGLRRAAAVLPAVIHGVAGLQPNAPQCAVDNGSHIRLPLVYWRHQILEMTCLHITGQED